MDGYFQSTLAANSLQQNINRANNAPTPTRTVPHFPPTNKDFSATELHTPDGIYSLLHEIFFETIAPQFAMGTRISIANAKDYPIDSSEEEGSLFNTASFSMTPMKKSAALPIPNAASSSSSRRTLRTMSTCSSIGAVNTTTNNNGLQVLTSPQRLMTASASGSNVNPYLPYSSPSFSSTPNPIANSHQQHQQQLVTGSYMMSSSQDLGMSVSQSHSPGDFTLPSLSTASQQQQQNHHNSSIGSLSSLFGRSSNNNSSNGKLSSSQLSSSIARSMSTGLGSSNSKPKNHLSKTNSTFVLRFLIHENLQKLLATKAFEDDFLFFNIGSSFIWVDAKRTSIKNCVFKNLSHLS
ncbi:MAG: hypothetical protein EXX96DRAFT_112331 [Benjaminiella poitrasii]|nr:MAG: hypothetical protein EXX96DRAFT_112331 [Benjaminiella poitrasii]